MADARVQVLVIGSGAGGATTALELARLGRDVLVIEEGRRVPVEEYGGSSTTAMQRLYRRRGMTPILGKIPIGYVEGCAVGGSTEINSGFWHRTPPETLLRWRSQFDLQESSVEQMAPHFQWAEEQVGVSKSGAPLPPSSELMLKGAEAMGWAAQEVPRAARNCKNTNACAHGCPTGAKQGMSRSLLPRAEEAGARLMTDCRVKVLLVRGRRVTGVLAERRLEDDTVELVRIDADHVFVCAGPTETPALLRRSGIRRYVGESLRIHPMLKVAAKFPREVDAHLSSLPLIQVKQFAPELSLGGGFFTFGHLAMLLSENSAQVSEHMSDARKMASYYVAVRGNGVGSVRSSVLDEGTVIRYRLSDEDVWNLSRGLARLSMLLLAAGAEVVFPAVHGLPPIKSELDAARWLDDRLSGSTLSLTTVHAFSSAPMGERRDRCATDSFGRVHGFDNLYLNDASTLPDSPGVNPQGSVMAFARRNALHFSENAQ